MTLSYLRTTDAANRPARHSRTDIVRAVIAWVREMRRRHRQRAELAGMTLRELQDAGLTPSERIGLVQKPLWRA
jgi:uncharacterized protein YjiS (DUF1127 family)